MVSRSLCPDFVGSVFSYAPDSQSVNFISQAEVSQCFKVFKCEVLLLFFVLNDNNLSRWVLD